MFVKYLGELDYEDLFTLKFISKQTLQATPCDQKTMIEGLGLTHQREGHPDRDSWWS